MSTDDGFAEGEPNGSQTAAGDEAAVPHHAGVAFGPFRQAWAPMLIVAIVLGLLAIASFGYGFVRAFERTTVGDRYFLTTPGWPTVLGHSLRAIGLTILAVLLVRCVNAVRRDGGGPEDRFPARHRTFWRAAACFCVAVLAVGVYEMMGERNRQQDRDFRRIFLPEFQSKPIPIARARIEVRRAYSEAGPRLEAMKRPNDPGIVYVSPKAEITGADISAASVQIGELSPGNQFVTLQITFTGAGAEKMEELTSDHYAKPLALFVDGELRAAPRVFATISRSGQFTGVFSLEEAEKLIRDAGR